MELEADKLVGAPKIPMGKGKIIYVAGPYTNRESHKVTENIWHACRVAVRLWELEWVVICPHMNTAHFEIYSNLSQEAYLKGDLKLLEMCDAIFLLTGWDSSKGAIAEYELAMEKELEVYRE